MTLQYAGVSLHVWRVPAAAVPVALWRMAADRWWPRRAGLRFVKFLGTGRGFGPGRPDLTRWAALAVHDGRPPDFPGWARIASASCRLDLLPLACRGTWSGQHPFPAAEKGPDSGHPFPPAEKEPDSGHPFPPAENGPGTDETREHGPVLSLTRARLRPARALAFWRAVGPVAAGLAGRDGLLAAFGIGEAPIGWQGTVSVWRQPADLLRFAYRHPQHRRAIEHTATTGWYAEELFARFAVTEVVGDTGVIGWVRDQTREPSG